MGEDVSAVVIGVDCFGAAADVNKVDAATTMQAGLEVDAANVATKPPGRGKAGEFRFCHVRFSPADLTGRRNTS